MSDWTGSRLVIWGGVLLAVVYVGLSAWMAWELANRGCVPLMLGGKLPMWRC